MMLHKFSTENIDDYHEQVLIDGQPIRCCGYTLTHRVDEVPCLELEMPIIPEIKDKKVVIVVSNKEEIARLMDKQEFDRFCEIWKEVHDEM